MTTYRRSLLFLVAFWLVFQTTAGLVIGWDRPEWGDEDRFCLTVEDFGHGLTTEKIRTYDQMSTPLPFILYGLWGRFFGFELWQLRILSVLIALVTYLLIHRWVYDLFREGRMAFWLTVFMVVHPYMVGLAIFVYSDMLAMLFLAAVLVAAKRSHPVLLGLALAGGLMCRQYLAFLWLAVLAYYLIDPRERRVSTLTAVVASALPLAALFLFWDGISPDNAYRKLYIDDGLGYHPESLTLYVVLTFVYLLPPLAFRIRAIYGDWRRLLLFLPPALLYWLIPIRASGYSVDIGVNTVGLFHRLLDYLLRGQSYVHVVFFIAFWLALPIVWFIIWDCIRRLRSRCNGMPQLLNLTYLSFLLVMPFSYLSWEKYFLPLVPILAARLLLLQKGQS